MSDGSSTEALKIQESRFTGDGSDLTLLHWLRQAEQAIETLPNDTLLANVQALHAFFLKLLLPSPNQTLPKPGRPIRHLVTRCLIKLHKRVESRSLFDFVQGLIRGVSDGGSKNMSAAENVARVACWYCIGEIIKEHGTNMMSFMAEICTSSTKVLRNSNLSVLLRTHAVVAFSRSLVSAGRALPDTLFKDLLKALRGGLQDRALPVQRACADTFVSLHTYTAACPLQATIDGVVPLALKSLETADFLTRRSLSRMVAHLLAATQAPGSGVVQNVVGKGGAKKDGEGDSGEPSVITSAPEDRGSKTLYTTQELLRSLSMPYNRPNAPRKLRNAIIDIYATLFTVLGSSYVESHYGEIVKHIMDELVIRQTTHSTRYEKLATREAVEILLRDLIGVRLLSEAGQVAAIRELTNSYLKKWQPQSLPGQRNTDKHVLIIVLHEIAGLLEQLGNAPPQITEILAEPLIRLLSHDSYSTRLAASYTLRRFCTLNPNQLPRMLNILLADVTKDLSILGTPTATKELANRIVGKSFALAALIAVSPTRPLYVSHDISTKVFDLAVSLLKKSGEHDIKSATIEVQIAWYLVAALMSLGPSFVKLHLPQLLVLWRNALPKPTSKDSSVGERGEAEWSFLLQVRECTLAAVLNFLRHNQPLINIDVARRLATLFTNTLNFVNGFATAYADALREHVNNPNAPTSPIFTARPSLVEREANLRRRVFQSFTALGPSSATESMQPALLQAAITVFADPENYSGSATQAAIAAQSGHFGGLWQATDGYAFGVTSLLGSREIEGTGEGDEAYLNRDRIEMAIESQLTHPILGSLEHDFLELLASRPLPAPPRPAPPASGVIDAGVELFSTMFPHQNLQGQVQSLATLSSHVRSSKLERNPGRKQAVVANTMAALKRSLANVEGTGPKNRKSLGSTQVSDMIKSLLQDAVLDSYPSIRQAAAESMGFLSSIAGSAYLSSQVQWLVDQVVNNRIPESRAGCAAAFGAIYSSVGGLAGGPILKTIVNILMSLATDPHPVVHFYAMAALSQVVNAANLSYEPYIPTTLGMLANIYLLETHEPDGGSLGSVNLRGDLPAYQVICRILHALIGVLGPELQEPGRIRSLVFLLVHEFSEETDEGLAVEGIKCVQQFLMFAPTAVDIPKLLSTFRTHLASTRRPLKVAAITALYQIVQRDAVLISKLGGNQLVEDLFGLLDDDPSLEGVRNVIVSWLQQTAAALPGGWIDLCQRIMTRTSAQKAAQAQQQPSSGPAFIDDEGESFAAEATSNTSNGLSSRWRTQLFALSCLHAIVLAAADGGKPEHFDPVLAQRLGLNPRHMLFSRVADLIRMAFSASAAMVMEIRLAGLVVLRDVVEKFATSADPDFEGSLLLEQHQAPIAAALTPSFGSDSAPEVLANAVQVCAVFVGSGVVKEVGRMGRILRLLTSALEQCKDGEMVSLGDAENLSANASVMLKISILAAWAELQVASTRQAYLNDVIKPYRYLLGPFWVGALRDYAHLRTDPEMGLGVTVGGLDLSAGMGRDVLLPYYEQAVSPLLHALAISLLASDAFVLGALDGQTFSSPTPPTTTPMLKPEPMANFYIIYGLAFESLVKAMGDSNAITLADTSLKAMQSLVRPDISGNVFDGAFFDELCTVCYRIGMGEGAVVKADMCEVVQSFVVARKGIMGYDAAQTRRCLAVITFVLRTSISSPESPSSFSYSDTVTDRVHLLKTAFLAYARIVECIDAPQRADLCAVAVHLFGELLKDETPHMDVAGGCLPVLKALLDLALGPSVQVPGVTATGDKLVHGLLSSCLGNIDDMRTRVNPVASIKIKNNLLAIVLVLTSLPASVKVSREVIEQICYDTGHNLGSAAERPELGLTAVHCATTLLLASLRPLPSPLNAAPAPSPILQHAALHLLPPLINHLADSVVASSTSNSNTVVDGVREIIKGLVQYTSGLPEGVKPRGYGILLPTLCLLLDPADADARSILHSVATATLLGLAQGSPGAFKDATMGMAEGERAGLERAVREAAGTARGVSGGGTGGAERKGIELRSFG
ncbi:putative clathrin-coated vesicle protein [Naematelia encephala]|uniref:Putative clathrin-coated vesicle protein n=1 Tax=Naematelia encephala TaxID=71784 RepID=A0A1Y2AQL1_9TREE|nr:putative clathrin-coated vesicle protein [Naematelia encephala]